MPPPRGIFGYRWRASKARQVRLRGPVARRNAAVAHVIIRCEFQSSRFDSSTSGRRALFADPNDAVGTTSAALEGNQGLSGRDAAAVATLEPRPPLHRRLRGGDGDPCPTAPVEQRRQKSNRARIPTVRGSPYSTPTPAPSMYSSSVRLLTKSCTSQLLRLNVSEKFRMSRSSVS